ncbi:MAG: hypothetical protein ACMUHY_06935 [Thermoplasmatota archaeon]
MLMHTQWYGTFILQIAEGGWTVADFIGAEKDPGSIASDMGRIADGSILDRERELGTRYEITHLTEERLRPLSPSAEQVDLWDFEVPHAHDKGYPMTLILEANKLKASRERMEGASDGNIMSSVGALSDIDSSLNLVQERLREWYGRFWPEISPLLEERSMLSVMGDDPDPSKLPERILAVDEALHDKVKDLEPPKIADDADLSGISNLASLASSLWRSREGLEGYIESEMSRVAPNLSNVVGPLIGARLIHSAGGLSRLARLPSSTVQVLGAEKMFFKFLKEGGKPPKHGVLFQHPWVHSLPAAKRGKMARSLASAASLASRMDAYGGGDSSELKERMERRARAVRDMKVEKKGGGGRQPPFREGWWADKARPKGDGRKRGRRKRR